MAFAFALLGLARDGIEVLAPGCVAKSWPAFWRDLARLSAERGG
jgi:3-phosphoshikimate 1-carboxyvinyltransferase